MLSGLMIATGCSDKEIEQKVLAEEAKAKQSLQEAEGLGVPEWTPQQYQEAKVSSFHLQILY